MSLPEGTYAGVSADPLRENHPDGARPFTGKVEVRTDEGKGFLVVVNGQVTAACYGDREGDHRGRDAITYLLNRSREIDLPVRYAQYRYSHDELRDAIEICRGEGLFLNGEDRSAREPAASGTDDTLLKRLSGQPGVRAVSVFFEGFPVQSAGDGDFEQVAAMAEDILRAGRKVAENLRMGALDQITLESDQKKCIIAPYGDLSLCLLTDPDANLGLIRLAMRSIQREMNEKG